MVTVTIIDMHALRCGSTTRRKVPVKGEGVYEPVLLSLRRRRAGRVLCVMEGGLHAVHVCTCVDVYM